MRSARRLHARRRPAIGRRGRPVHDRVLASRLRFDLRTGEALDLPATEPVRTSPTRVIGGSVYVEID